VSRGMMIRFLSAGGMGACANAAAEDGTVGKPAISKAGTNLSPAWRPCGGDFRAWKSFASRSGSPSARTPSWEGGPAPADAACVFG
jgi:hypothetical protein